MIPGQGVQIPWYGGRRAQSPCLPVLLEPDSLTMRFWTLRVNWSFIEAGEVGSMTIRKSPESKTPQSRTKTQSLLLGGS